MLISAVSLHNWSNFIVFFSFPRLLNSKALERKTGARGLRSILENTLLNTMFDLPSLENVVKVVVDEGTITSDVAPLLIYEDAPKPKVVGQTN